MKTMLALTAVSLLLITGAHTHEIARFDDYKVFRVTPTTELQHRFLNQLQNVNEYDFWTSPRGINFSVDIMVPPHKLPEFTELANRINLKALVHIRNLQKLIDEEKAVVRRGHNGFGWTNYHRIREIYDWLDALAKKYPDVVEVVVGGTSYEGRQIKGVKVSYKSGNPGVFIEGGIHAREWISPATVTWMLNQLLTSNDTNVRDIAENYDWFIFPSINPDGYEYSHTTNRFWRKTRSRNATSCPGTDLNRNWGFQWREKYESSSPCHTTYAGPSPFSEIESRSLSEYITSVANNIQVFLGFHSFSQMILLPYGFSNERVSNYDFLMKVAAKAAKSLSKRYGTKYIYGNVVDILYPANGASMDWMRGTLETPIVYTYELRDNGRYGFVLPPRLIVPTAEETLDSVITILQESREVALQDLAQRNIILDSEETMVHEVTEICEERTVPETTTGSVATKFAGTHYIILFVAHISLHLIEVVTSLY